jgi:hypothetical protein
MPQFVIEREVAGAGKLSESEIRDLSLRSLEVLKEMGPQIQWLHSYVTEDKVYCVYLAPEHYSRACATSGDSSGSCVGRATAP